METNIFFLICLICGVHSATFSQSIQTKQGKIVGINSETLNGLPYTSFMGIPFAQEPVGPLFLQKPVPALPWNDTFVADQEIKCLQLATDADGQPIVDGQDDCLVVNVHTTANLDGQEPLLPVMVFIHGGGFTTGAGTTDAYGPERLLDYGVILVTVNYRLGALGFLSTNDDVIPGNLGLWDQNLALKWVQANIADFGGDPNKVTLFGQSAGAMSVSFHMLSPQSKGLFHGVIAQSGAATSLYMYLDRSSIYYTRLLSESLGCESGLNSQEILDCLRQVDSSEITKLNGMFDVVEGLPVIFKPEVDNYTSDPFVPKDPWEIAESGDFNHVPLISGATSDEGLYLVLGTLDDEPFWADVGQKWDTQFAPLVIFHRLTDTITDEILDLCKVVSDHFYVGVGFPTIENIPTQHVPMVSDINFNAVSTLLARKIAEKSTANVYEYYYKYMGSFGFFEFLSLPYWQQVLKSWGQTVGLNLYPPHYGVAHADDMFMLFKARGLPLETVYTDEDKVTSKKMLTLWSNFAKTGNPTPNPEEIEVVWEKLGPNSNQRLEIGSGSLEMSLNQNLEERIEFWKTIWNK